MELLNTCIAEGCSGMAKIVGGLWGGPGIIGMFIEPFLGEAPCRWCCFPPVLEGGWFDLATCAKACATLMGK